MATKKQPGINGFKYKQQYGVIIVCKDEQHQSDLYKQLKQAGHKLKVVTV